MMTDDELLQYHYDDGLAAAERARIASALAADPASAQRLRRLLAELDACANTEEAPVPAATLRRWHDDLTRAARRENDALRPALRWRWAAGLSALAVALLATTFGVGIFPTGEKPEGAAPSAPLAAAPTAPADAADAVRYERSLQWHLADTEQQLADLGTVSGDERARVIDRVIVRNRLYAVAAERANEARFARVLRSFNPILEGLAGKDVSRGEIDGGIAQLHFELKVMQARLATGAAASTTPARQTLAL